MLFHAAVPALPFLGDLYVISEIYVIFMSINTVWPTLLYSW